MVTSEEVRGFFYLPFPLISAWVWGYRVTQNDLRLREIRIMTGVGTRGLVNTGRYGRRSYPVRLPSQKRGFVLLCSFRGHIKGLWT